MDLDNKRILFAVSSMGLGHVHRSLPVIRHLLAAGSRLMILSHGRALETLKLELAEQDQIEYLEFADYPPIQRGRGLAHYAYFIRDLLETGQLIKKETALLKQLLAERNIDLVFSDGRFGLADKHLPCFLLCHHIRFILPRGLGIFQPLSDLAQYRLLRKFNRVIVPDFADAEANLAGSLSHNWMARKLDAFYIGFLSSAKRVPAATATDIVFITGGFIEAERRKIIEWAKQHLGSLAKKVAVVLGERGSGTAEIKPDSTIVLYASIRGEARNALLSSAQTLVGRSGYTTLMDICELGLRAALTPTPCMTEQQYLARHLARWQHPLPVELPKADEMDWVGIDGNALPAPIRDWSTEESLQRLADFLAGYDHAKPRR